MPSGAQMVHPRKAYVIRHIPIPEDYESLNWEDEFRLSNYYRTAPMPVGDTVPTNVLPSVRDYLLRLTIGMDFLFGPVDFDLHCVRTYPQGELPFHNDLDEDFGVEDDMDDLVVTRAVTCIHNVTAINRPLHFQRKLWTGHMEEFPILLPAMSLVAFGDELIFDYEHGIPKSEEVKEYRSVVTRFKKVQVA